MTQLNPLQLARGQDTIIDSQSISVNTDYNLPSTVRKGQVYLVLSEVTNNALLTIKSSDGDTIETIRNGYCLVVALQNSPTDSTHWKVIEVQDAGEWTPVPAFNSNGTAVLINGGGVQPTYNRHNKVVSIAGYSTLIKGTATGSMAISGLPYASTTGIQALPTFIEDQILAPANYVTSRVEISSTSAIMNFVWQANGLTTAAITVDATHLGTGNIDIIWGGSYIKN